jgi:hypothetical protein
MAIHELTRSYPSRYGAPIIRGVDSAIFELRYFGRCVECTFCFDACCRWGVDVDLENVRRIEAHAPALEALTGVARDRWFEPEIDEDAEFPGGRVARTRTDERGCIFHAREGRGCLLHRYALESGLDYHDLKPMISALFPITFESTILCAAEEVADGSLICSAQGPTLYESGREEVGYYFGDGLVAELDALAGLK